MVALYANELLEYSAAAKSVVDQMIMTGSSIDDLDFVNPTSAGFDTPPHIHKVFHPEGGGLTYQSALNDNIKGPDGSGTLPGIFIGAFNNVEWTPSTSTDVIMSFHKIRQDVCAKINEKITGSATIPALTDTLRVTLINTAVHGAGNVNLDTTVCSGCDGYPTLCVENSGHSFYTILAAR